MTDEMQEQKESLIELIEWYRDEYHKKDSVHNDLIEKIKNTTDQKVLDLYEKTVDGWLDY